MSFVSDAFVVKDLDKFKKFCDVVLVKYDVLDYNRKEVLVYSDSMVEPPTTYVWDGKERELDFNIELHRLSEPGQRISYMVEYEVEVTPRGEVEYYCEDMLGMPPEKGDAHGEASSNTVRIFN